MSSSTTPGALEHTTTTAPSSTRHERLPKNDTTHIPNASLCTITQVGQGTSLCHLLAEDSDSRLISQLEFAWGLEPGTLDVNNARNTIFLTENLLNLFKEGDWALVPSAETIEEVAWQTTVAGVSEFDSQEAYEYEFVCFKGTADDIVRQNPETGQPIVFHSPYKDFPLVHSHAHPCFVMCDIGLKHTKFNHSLEGELRGRVAICRNLYKRWLSAKPWVMPCVDPSSSSESSTHSSSSSPSRSNLSSVSAVASYPSASARLKRKRSAEDGATDLEGAPKTKRQRQIKPDLLDELGRTHWSIGGWVNDVANCGSPDSASAPGDSEAQAALEKYRNEDASSKIS